jgi:hypothetical protein
MLQFHTLMGIRDIRVGGETGGSVFSGELSMEILGCSEPWFYGYLGVRNFGFTVLWLVRYLGVRIPGFTVPLDLRVRSATRIFGLFSDVCCGSYGSSVISWVAWHVGSCFSAAYDASTRLGHSNECSLYDS